MPSVALPKFSAISFLSPPIPAVLGLAVDGTRGALDFIPVGVGGEDPDNGSYHGSETWVELLRQGDFVELGVCKIFFVSGGVDAKGS